MNFSHVWILVSILHEHFQQPRIELGSAALQANSLPVELPVKPKEYWSRLSLPSPGHLSDPRIEPESPALAGGFFTAEPPGKPYAFY